MITEKLLIILLSLFSAGSFAFAGEEATVPICRKVIVQVGPFEFLTYDSGSVPCVDHQGECEIHVNADSCSIVNPIGSGRNEPCQKEHCEMKGF